MVDEPVLAKKLAVIRDAVARVREVLPDSAEAFRKDRTAAPTIHERSNVFEGGDRWISD